MASNFLCIQLVKYIFTGYSKYIYFLASLTLILLPCPYKPDGVNTQESYTGEIVGESKEGDT